MLRIFVGSRREIIQTVDGSKMRVFPLMVQHDGKARYLQDVTTFPELDRIEIAVHRWLRPRHPTIFIPPASLHKAIAQFLSTYHAKQNLSFDCYSFANMAKGIESNKKTNAGDVWNTEKMLSLPEAGQVVFLLNDRGSFVHAAIYLAHHFYISVLGAGGDLEVATLEDMKRDFRASTVLLATPK